MKYRVVAHPGAKQTKVVVQTQEGEQIYHVYTNAKAIDGAANEAVIKLMADFLGIKKYQIRLVSGYRSKHKVLFVQGR